MNRLTEWLNHGLRYARWPASRAARIAVLVSLGLLLVSAYLVQTGQIVTASRHVETLRRDLTVLRRDNALRLSAISQLTSSARLIERAGVLGFEFAEAIEYVMVDAALRDDAPSLRDGNPDP